MEQNLLLAHILPFKIISLIVDLEMCVCDDSIVIIFKRGILAFCTYGYIPKYLQIKL